MSSLKDAVGTDRSLAQILESGVSDPENELAREFLLSHMHQSDGTTKMTSSRRLDDVNRLILSMLDGRTDFDLLDVGISSGISTAELVDALRPIVRTLRVVGCDRTLNGVLTSIGGVELLSDEGGRAMLLRTSRRLLVRPTSWNGSLRNLVSHAAFAAGSAMSTVSRAFGRQRVVSLISGQLTGNPNVSVIAHDIFIPRPEWQGRFGVIRVANLLNRSYFDEPTLRAGIANVRDWLGNNGVLVVARTGSDGINHGTAFTKHGRALHVMKRIGDGSEIEALVA